MGINPPLPTRTLGAAKRLREIGTDAERALWFHLRAGRLCGYKFRRQHPHPSLCRRFLLPRIETGRGIRRITTYVRPGRSTYQNIEASWADGIAILG